MKSRKPSIFKDSAINQVYNTPNIQKKKASMIINQVPPSPMNSQTPDAVPWSTPHSGPNKGMRHSLPIMDDDIGTADGQKLNQILT